jgi:hypothetical protein
MSCARRNQVHHRSMNILKRIQRAAKFEEKSTTEFLRGVIMEAIRCNEADMILSPSGEVIGDRTASETSQSLQREAALMKLNYRDRLHSSN